MAKVGIPKTVPSVWSQYALENQSISYRKKIVLRFSGTSSARTFNNFLRGGGKSSFSHSTEQKRSLGTNYQPKIEIWLHPQSEMLFESIRKCRIRIPFEILLIVDQKISKIEPEMAELVLFGGTIKRRIGHRSFSFLPFIFDLALLPFFGQTLIP